MDSRERETARDGLGIAGLHALSAHVPRTRARVRVAAQRSATATAVQGIAGCQLRRPRAAGLHRRVRAAGSGDAAAGSRAASGADAIRAGRTAPGLLEGPLSPRADVAAIRT